MQIRLTCGAPPKVAGEAGPIRLPIAPIVQTVDPRQCRLLPFCTNDVGKWGKSLASCTGQSEHPSEPLRLRRFRANGTR